MKNKYLITLALLLSIAFVNTNAQQAKKGRIEIGLQGGLNTSTADTHYHSNRYRIGYNTGATFTYYMGDAFSLNTGLEYAQKGSDTKLDYIYTIAGKQASFSPDGRMSKNYKLSYLQLPVTIGYEFIQKGKLAIDFRFGFNFAYGIGISVKEDIKGTLLYADGTSKYIDRTVKHTDWNWLDMHRFDFGVVGGTSLKYDKVFIKLTYNYGLTNIGNAVVNNAKYKARWKNRDLSLSVGYNFITK